MILFNQLVKTLNCRVHIDRHHRHRCHKHPPPAHSWARPSHRRIHPTPQPQTAPVTLSSTIWPTRTRTHSITIYVIGFSHRTFTRSFLNTNSFVFELFSDRLPLTVWALWSEAPCFISGGAWTRRIGDACSCSMDGTAMTCIGRVIFLGAFWTMTIYLVADENNNDTITENACVQGNGWMVCAAFTHRAQGDVAVVTEEAAYSRRCSGRHRRGCMLSPALLLVSTIIFPAAKLFMAMQNGIVSIKIQIC